jgi:hypothetical protein
VDKQALLRKLDGIFDEAARLRMWGKIEIDIKEGVPILIHRLITEKINSVNTNGGPPRADEFQKKF